ncbi:28 kDa ookinete surface protein, putative [Plasmodium malariae]|uniref:28 kDa ookinete surface protein, putative n=1 Tax=Plasmodium malariae TaxID=5858 RepID=A0A1C3KE25_PLAMA|nr:28 kDa ookinete surface protein, putative [Plasmodium malariae]
MNYSVFLLFFIQLVIKYSNAIVNESTICINGDLVQMSNHFECRCNEGFVLTYESICEKKGQCEKIEDLNNFCGHNATCTNILSASDPKKLACTCNRNYIPVNDQCIPSICDKVVCGQGKCIVDPYNANNTICACHVGIVHDENKKCEKPGETKCILKCKEDEECKLQGTFYECAKIDDGGAGSGGEGNGGEGSGGEGSGENGSTGYSVMNEMSMFSLLVILAVYMMAAL